jgi:signal transduction histidine kinase
VITNLVGNAIKFTPKGSVSCSCKLIGYGKDENGEDSVFLEFCVADTGIGIKVRILPSFCSSCLTWCAAAAGQT